MFVGSALFHEMAPPFVAAVFPSLKVLDWMLTEQSKLDQSVLMAPPSPFKAELLMKVLEEMLAPPLFTM